MREPSSQSAVVVGIDGSRSARRAALWGLDEAVGRDIPLRLIYAVDPDAWPGTDPDADTRKLETAEIAVRETATAIEATEKPVKIEAEVVPGRPVATLVRASRSAELVCVGAVGLKHFARDRVGSTAAALATSSHCPLAIIGGQDATAAPEISRIVAVADGSPERSAVLRRAMEEAQLRRAPLHALTTWQSYGHNADHRAVAEGNHRARAQLDRSLDSWARRYPDLDVQSVVVHGSILDYLADDPGDHPGSAVLIIVDAGDRDDVAQLVGPAGHAALHRNDYSVLIEGLQHL